jgi:DNA-directed RNA polymerase subunit RPC12/RpoP
MQCPGQDSRYWDGAAIFEYKCPKCGSTLEFFKDDSKRKCKNCGNEVFNPHMDFGCASYCPYAEQCLGNLPPELLAKKQEQLITKTAAEVKRLLGDNFRAIGEAGRVARHAEALAEERQGSNKAVVVLAAYFQALDAMETGTLSELAAPILKRHGASQGLNDEVCALLVGQEAATPGGHTNLQILTEARQLAAREKDEE